MRSADILSSSDFCSIPVIFISQHYMRLVSADTNRFEFLYDASLLWARIRIVIDQFARPIRNEEDCDTGIPRGCNELYDAGHRYRVMLSIKIVQLAIRKRAFERELKIDIADHSFIDIENDRGRKILGISLPGHCTP